MLSASTLKTSPEARSLKEAAPGSFNKQTLPATALPARPTAPSMTSFEQMDTPDATAFATANKGKEGSFLSDTTRSRIAVEVTIDDMRIAEVLSIQILQSLGEHCQLHMRFYQDQVQATGTMLIDGAEKLLGKVTEVELYDKNGSSTERLQQLFVIADVQFEHQALNEGILSVIGYAPTWLLDGAPHFETFYKKSLTTIATSVTQPLSQVKAALKATPTLVDSLPFICRYNESAWNFLKRISMETGQWLYFNGKELIFGQPEAKQGGVIVYGNNCSQLQMSLQARPVQQQIFDYEAFGHQPINTGANQYNGNAGAYNLMAYKKSMDLFGTSPSVAAPSFLPPSAANLELLGKSKGGQKVSGMYYVKGESTAHQLRVGLNVDVELNRLGQKASHAPVRITRVMHNWDVTGKYHNSFEAIPAAAELQPEITYQKPITYPMLAEVIDNADNQGRVRVQFMGWQQEGRAETDFIRVLSPDAGSSDVVGQNRGYVFVPEVGDQVYVDFEFGNPDRPFITGSVFHGQNGIGGKTGNNTKSIRTKSGHTIELDDTAEGTHILIKDPGGNEIYLDTQGKNITISAPETMTLKCKNMRIEVEEQMMTQVGQNINTAAGMNINSSAGMNIANSAAKDLLMMATNIIGTAEDSVAHSAANAITQAGGSFEASATEEDMKIYSNKKVVNTSGEKGNLF